MNFLILKIFFYITLQKTNGCLVAYFQIIKVLIGQIAKNQTINWTPSKTVKKKTAKKKTAIKVPLMVNKNSTDNDNGARWRATTTAAQCKRTREDQEFECAGPRETCGAR